MGAGDWIKNFAWHFGLGLTLPRVDEAGIRTEIYAVTATQIHARAFIPLKGVELVFWVIPTPLNQILTDEEIVTLKDPGTTSVVARQELDIGGWMKSLRYWHADFHRIRDPSPAD